MSAIEQFQDSVFKAIGIERVIWVDDFFRTSRINEAHFENLQQEIQIRYEMENCADLNKVSGLEHIDFSDPLEFVLSQLPKDVGVVKHILSIISGDEPDDLSEESFTSFAGMFSKYFKFSSMSLQEWNKQKDDLVKLGNTLFFIDLDLSRDGGANDEGKFIIEYILRNSLNTQYCVLFTHNCQHGPAEEVQRLDIVRQLDNSLADHNFSVLSKSIFNTDDKLGIDFKAPELLKRAFIRKLCSELANSMSAEMKNSIDEVNSQLRQHSIYELDGSIFYRTLKEGASEFEVMHRLFSLKQSSAVHKIIKSNQSIIADLKRLRDIQKIQFKPQQAEEREPFKYFKSLFKPGQLFLQLRDNEIWTDSSSINLVHAPLRCGDTFVVTTPQGLETKYILLEQSCDLIVRDSGQRKLNEALLVAFETVEVSSTGAINTGLYKHINLVNSLSKHHTFSTPGVGNDTIIFDFSNGFNVNLNLLDMCVYNENGVAEFSASNNSCPELIFLTGWMARYSNLYEKLVQVAEDGTLKIKSRESICGTLLNFTLDSSRGINVDLRDDTLSINIRRGARLNSPFVDILLRKLYAHKTRLPLDHDFSNFTWE